MISLEIHREIHSKLMQRKSPTSLWGSPFDNGWIGFVLYDHKIKDEITLSEIIDYFDRWIRSTSLSEILKEERNIGTLSLYSGIFSNLRNKEGLVKQIQDLIKKKIIELSEKKKWKFGLFNSPEIFYSTVAGLMMCGALDNETQNILSKHVLNEMENNWFNKIYRFSLYSAALLELKIQNTGKIIDFLISVNVKKLNIDEVVPLLWLTAKYGEQIFKGIQDKTVQRLIEEKKEELWEQFENQYVYFSYDLQTSEDNINDTQVYSLSTFELGMIDDFLACFEKAYKTDPNMVFDLLDFHPIVKESSEKLFKDGHYSQAVFEAYKALIHYVKKKSGIKTLDGQALMGKVFAVKYNKETLEVTKKPIIQLNELHTREELDEQSGFMHLFIGSVLGIRNPKAHAGIEQRDPFKTLEYLALASLLAKRIDEAKLNEH